MSTPRSILIFSEFQTVCNFISGLEELCEATFSEHEIKDRSCGENSNHVSKSQALDELNFKPTLSDNDVSILNNTFINVFIFSLQGKSNTNNFSGSL